MSEEAPELLAALGEYFSQYAQDGSFDFDYCDVLANKGEAFYKHGELDLKALICVSILTLGTSHGRWFVEHMFMQMAGRQISDELAERIKVEIEVQGIDFKRQFVRLQSSISADQADLHEALQDILQEMPDDD